MPTWSGWQNQFLNAASILITPPNRTFMNEWANHAPGTCKNNPIDLSHSVSGSTRCGDTVAGFGRTQNYPSHTAAAHAFTLSVDTDWAQPIKAALNTGNPFQIDNRAPVIAALRRWGSTQFANWYANANSDGTGGGGGGGGGIAPHTHKAWVDLQRTINKRLPSSLRKVDQANRATLRAVSRGSKVKH